MQTRITEAELEAPPHTDLPAAYYLVAGHTWQSDRLRRKVLMILSSPGAPVLLVPLALELEPTRKPCACPACQRQRIRTPSRN